MTTAVVMERRNQLMTRHAVKSPSYVAISSRELDKKIPDKATEWLGSQTIWSNHQDTTKLVEFSSRRRKRQACTNSSPKSLSEYHRQTCHSIHVFVHPEENGGTADVGQELRCSGFLLIKHQAKAKNSNNPEKVNRDAQIEGSWKPSGWKSPHLSWWSFYVGEIQHLILNIHLPSSYCPVWLD